VLGLVAFAIAMLRGLIGSAGINATLGQASLMLFAFALIGFLVGAMAERIVEESVRGSMAAQAAAQQAENKKAENNKAERPKVAA
jgi:hypothetical protein